MTQLRSPIMPSRNTPTGQRYEIHPDREYKRGNIHSVNFFGYKLQLIKSLMPPKKTPNPEESKDPLGDVETPVMTFKPWPADKPPKLDTLPREPLPIYYIVWRQKLLAILDAYGLVESQKPTDAAAKAILVEGAHGSSRTQRVIWHDPVST
ncbi:hypothetical protein EDD86DRAFT_114151 [Gorgonomyces haynaldii]|nr:hypothetical protein EDD86DRAFT_114151 [Gorgonomyces haynaldii]